MIFRHNVVIRPSILFHKMVGILYPNGYSLVLQMGIYTLLMGRRDGVGLNKSLHFYRPQTKFEAR